MKSRTRSRILAIAITMAAAPSLASSPGSCLFTGSYVGYDDAGKVNWISNFQGQSGSEGTVVMEHLMDPATLTYFFPGAVDYTEFRGIWRRIDGNTFRVVMVSLAFDENRAPLGIAKLINIDRLDETCEKSSIVESTLEVYAPDANPFEDPYLYTMPLNAHDGYRMVFP